MKSLTIYDDFISESKEKDDWLNTTIKKKDGSTIERETAFNNKDHKLHKKVKSEYDKKFANEPDDEPSDSDTGSSMIPDKKLDNKDMTANKISTKRYTVTPVVETDKDTGLVKSVKIGGSTMKRLKVPSQQKLEE